MLITHPFLEASSEWIGAVPPSIPCVCPACHGVIFTSTIEQISVVVENSFDLDTVGRDPYLRPDLVIDPVNNTDRFQYVCHFQWSPFVMSAFFKLSNTNIYFKGMGCKSRLTSV